jgi:cobalt-zinc-cadmium efflux system membrane fusion protein
MVFPNPFRLLLPFVMALALAAGCDSRPGGDDHDHDHAGEAEQGHGHDDGYDHEDHGGGHDDHDDHADHDDHEDHDDGHEEDHGDEDHGHSHEEGEPDFAAISPTDAGRHGIVVATAAPGTLAEAQTLTGRLIMDPAHVALVRARFPGPVVAVTKAVGDPVARGEVLARVESNESLSVYDIRSPVAGVVLERQTNVGDVAGSDPLFRVGDPARLMAELTAFPSQQARVQRGAPVRIQVGGMAEGPEIPGTVTALVPELEGHTQALRVRVALDLDGAPAAVPGQFVTARVGAGSSEAPVLVPAGAIQRLEGREVVFVPEAEGFRARPVTAGHRNADQVVITAGLASGERYVAEGAFLLKAEIGKNLAEHTH